MMRPSDEWRDPARWILMQEAGGRRSAEGLVEGAERVCSKLLRDLGQLLGREGVRALLARALQMAQPSFPFLRGVAVECQGSSCLKGIREAVAGQEVSTVEEGLVGLLANTLRLLSSFIGEHLAAQQVNMIWPDAPGRGRASGSGEAGR